MMKLPFGEIWDFKEMLGSTDREMAISLCAGKVVVPVPSADDIPSILDKKFYNPEWLPELFTYREIIWQPDVFENKSQALPSLRILKAYCEDMIESLSSDKEQFPATLYRELFSGVVSAVEHCLESIVKKEAIISSEIGKLRRDTFPVMTFFVYHPLNRKDYYEDALKRLNYAVRITLTEYYGKYSDLEYPYWKVEGKKQPAHSQKP